jgi:hypothetical protein
MILEAELLGTHQGRQGPTSFVPGELVEQVRPEDGDVVPPASPMTIQCADSSARNALCSPQPPAQSRSIQEEIELLICIPLQTPIIRAGPKLRRSKTPKSGFTMRRSERIPRKLRAANSTLQAQNVLKQKLGITVDYNDVDDEIVEKFRPTFAAPLSADMQEALETLFGDGFDPVAMNLDMVGLDAEAS